MRICLGNTVNVLTCALWFFPLSPSFFDRVSQCNSCLHLLSDRTYGSLVTHSVENTWLVFLFFPSASYIFLFRCPSAGWRSEEETSMHSPLHIPP